MVLVLHFVLHTPNLLQEGVLGHGIILLHFTDAQSKAKREVRCPSSLRKTVAGWTWIPNFLILRMRYFPYLSLSSPFLLFLFPLFPFLCSSYFLLLCILFLLLFPLPDSFPKLESNDPWPSGTQQRRQRLVKTQHLLMFSSQVKHQLETENKLSGVACLYCTQATYAIHPGFPNTGALLSS